MVLPRNLLHIMSKVFVGVNSIARNNLNPMVPRMKLPNSSHLSVYFGSQFVEPRLLHALRLTGLAEVDGVVPDWRCSTEAKVENGTAQSKRGTSVKLSTSGEPE